VSREVSLRVEAWVGTYEGGGCRAFLPVFREWYEARSEDEALAAIAEELAARSRPGVYWLGASVRPFPELEKPKGIL